MQNKNNLTILRNQIDLIDHAIFDNICHYWWYLSEFRIEAKLSKINSLQDLFGNDVLPSMSHNIEIFKDLLSNLLKFALAIKPNTVGKSLVDKDFFESGLKNIKKVFISLFLVRFKLSLAIGAYKSEAGLKIIDSERWYRVKALKIKQAKKNGLNLLLTNDFWEEVHSCSCDVQQNLMRYS